MTDQVIGLLGPTGVGKTAVAVELARRLGTKIISCDSMQVYKGFPVLTNQPWGPEDDPGLHQLVGFADPGTSISAAQYADLARPLVERDCRESGCAMVVGGSGLYMRAALAPLATKGPADLEERAHLEERALREGSEVLHADLARLDAVAAQAIDHRNVRRVIRALERVKSGETWSGRDDLWEPVYYRPTLVVGLVMDRSELATRIARRTEKMLRAGAVEEVERFREDRGNDATGPGLPGICSAIGYPEICLHLDGVQTLGDTAEQIETATRRYARRQITWLRRVRDAVMIEASGRDAAQIASDIVGLIECSSRSEGKPEL